MARLGGFDVELRQTALFDATVVPEGWFDDTFVGAASGAAALQASVTSSGAATGALTTAIQCVAAIVAGAVLTASLTTSIKAAAAVNGSTAVTAALTTQIKPAAAIAGSSALTAALTTGIPLAAAANGSGAATAALTTAIKCAAGTSGQATLSAALTTGIPLNAAIAGTGASSAAVTTAIRCAAAIAGSSALTANLTAPGGAASLQAGVSGSAALSAALTTAIQCAATVVGTTTLSGSLSSPAIASDIIHLFASVSTPIAIVSSPVYVAMHGSYADAVVADGAIASWRLNDAGPTFVDRIAGSNGTGSGPIQVQQPGAVFGDTAVQFDQSTPAVIAVPATAALSVLNAARQFTQELWIQMPPEPASTTFYRVLSYNDSDGQPTTLGVVLAYFDAATADPAPAHWTFEVTVNGNEVDSDDVNGFPLVTLMSGSWYHLVAAIDYDASTFRLYVNGAFVRDAVQVIDTPPDLGHGLNIGGPLNVDDGTIAWIDGVDELALYASALTDEPAADHYAFRTPAVASIIALAASVSTPILLTGSTV